MLKKINLYYLVKSRIIRKLCCTVKSRLSGGSYSMVEARVRRVEARVRRAEAHCVRGFPSSSPLKYNVTQITTKVICLGCLLSMRSNIRKMSLSKEK